MGSACMHQHRKLGSIRGKRNLFQEGMLHTSPQKKKKRRIPVGKCTLIFVQFLFEVHVIRYTYYILQKDDFTCSKFYGMNTTFFSNANWNSSLSLLPILLVYVFNFNSFGRERVRKGTQEIKDSFTNRQKRKVA